MKKLLLLLLLSIIITINAVAQEDKTVTLTVSGQGKTKEEAKQVALRSAIEQAFGTFISSKTEILNDKLVKDEIVSVTNGNIQKFDVLSEVQLPDGGYATTLKAVVSVTKLTSFCESKGVEVEFKGGLFAANIKMQKLNEDNELITVKNLTANMKELIANSFDYIINSKDPVMASGKSDKWNVEINVGIKVNSNFNLFKNYLLNSLLGISMKSMDIESYNSLNKPYYCVSFKTSDSLGANIKRNDIYLRNKNSLSYIQDLFWYAKCSEESFIIYDGILNFSINDPNISWVYNSPWQDPNGVYFPADDFFISGKTAAVDLTYSNRHLTYLGIIKQRVHKYNEIRQNIIHNRERQIEDSLKMGDRNYNSYQNTIDKNKEELRNFADSSHAFCTHYNSGQNYEGIGRIETFFINNNGDIDDEHSENTIPANMAIRLTLTSKQFGSFIIKKEYTTEDLSKIIAFKVSSGKSLILTLDENNKKQKGEKNKTNSINH